LLFLMFPASQAAMAQLVFHVALRHPEA
jgi:hypothetical protein